MRQDDPSKQAEVWTRLVTSLKEVIGTSKSESTGVTQIIQMQTEHNKNMMSLLDRVLQIQNEPPEPARTAIDDFDKIFTLVDKVRNWGGSGGGRRGAWDIGYDIAKDIGLPLLNTF